MLLSFYFYIITLNIYITKCIEWDIISKQMLSF